MADSQNMLVSLQFPLLKTRAVIKQVHEEFASSKIKSKWRKFYPKTHCHPNIGIKVRIKTVIL